MLCCSHRRESKYTCPRCSIRTCSLPCIKRHKLLSECSGVRDPTTYRKRKDLATPASFDEDYNFITRVERSLERADRDADARGIPPMLLAPPPRSRGSSRTQQTRRPVKGELRLGEEIERSGVVVKKAPVGMSRSRINRTHWNSKHKALSWTVEWVLDESQGSKFYANCFETVTISQAFRNGVGRKAQPQPSRKRKLVDEAPSETAARDPKSDPSKVKRDDDQNDKNGSAMSEPAQQQYFYLHDPIAQGKTRRVNHVGAEAILAEVLKGRLVLEFPTIYVLSDPPDRLSPVFEMACKNEDLGEVLGEVFQDSGQDQKFAVEDKDISHITTAPIADQIVGAHHSDFTT